MLSFELFGGMFLVGGQPAVRDASAVAIRLASPPGAGYIAEQKLRSTTARIASRKMPCAGFAVRVERDSDGVECLRRLREIGIRLRWFSVIWTRIF